MALRTIVGATEYRLRSADEMAELLHTAVETYADMGEEMSGTTIAHAVARDAQRLRERDEGDRELAAAGIL